MTTNQHGLDAERSARGVASTLGLPDFVFTAPTVAKGDGTREVGDALLIANGLGAVVQVKSRKPGATDDGTAWLAKHGGKAARQAAGSLRSIRIAQERGEPLVARPVRTANLTDEFQRRAGLALDMDVSDWPSLIVVNHPGAFGVVPTSADCFWITLQDWRELWTAIRSVTGVLTYVRRCLNAGVMAALGEEQRRFRVMVEADVRAHGSSAWLTTDAYNDPRATQLYRELIDRVWPNDCPLPSVSMTDYRLIVDFLDRTAPSLQPTIGKWILSKRAEQAEHGKSGGLTPIDNDRLLIFKADRWDRPGSEAAFDAQLVTYAVVRSAEASAQLGYFVPALAVGHLVGHDHVDYHYALTRVHAEPTKKERALVWHEGGLFNTSTRTVSPLSVEASSPVALCPCGSGLKTGNCPQGLFS